MIVTVRLARAKEKGVRFSVAGAKTKVQELAAKVYEETAQRLRSSESRP